MLGIFESEVSRSATASATAVCGSTRSPASRQAARIAAAVSVSSARPASNSSRIAASVASGSTKRPDCFSDAISRRTLPASRPAGLEQQPLEIRGDLDVHRRRGGGVNLAHLVDAGLERARQDVVDVGGDPQPADRQAHLLGDVARKDVAEIAGRHGEVHRARRRAERHRRGEIVHHLRDDPRPVDRIDARTARPASRKP